MDKINEMSNAFQTSKRLNVYRKLGWHRYDPVGVEQIISRYDVISILSLRDKSTTEKMCVTSKIQKIQMVTEKWFVLMINRIRRIQMFIEQRFAEEASDPVGVEQIISRYDVISILSLRDKSVTEKMCVTSKIQKIKMVSEKWFVQIINEIRSAQMFVKKRFARILKRIRRIQMFIEQRFAGVSYDPIGVAQNISRHDVINILSLRDKSVTDKFILSTSKTGRL